MSDPWNVAQYERFKQERAQPYFDLLALLEPRPNGRVIDLGCGTGELTRELHRKLGARQALGVDNSDAMLKESARFAGEGLEFAKADIGSFEDSIAGRMNNGQPFDVVFSNAALHWLDHHEQLFPRLWRMLAPGGQLAVQMPLNHDYPSHTVAEEVAARAPYAAALKGYVRKSPVLAPEVYAHMLFRLGAREQVVQMRVYGHVLDSSAGVVEWVKGTLLTDYEKRLSPEVFSKFLAEYRHELVATLGDERPFFYPFKRLLFWARA